MQPSVAHNLAWLLDEGGNSGSILTIFFFDPLLIVPRSPIFMCTSLLLLTFPNTWTVLQKGPCIATDPAGYLTNLKTHRPPPFLFLLFVILFVLRIFIHLHAGQNYFVVRVGNCFFSLESRFMLLFFSSSSVHHGLVQLVVVVRYLSK